MPLASVNARRYTAPGRGVVLDGFDVIATGLTLRPRAEGWRCWRMHLPALGLYMAHDFNETVTVALVPRSVPATSRRNFNG